MIRRRMIWTVVLVALLLAFLAVLYFAQHHLIYSSRPYVDEELPAPGSYTTLHFQTSQGPQHAYFLTARNRAPVAGNALWVVFGGNETLALDWFGFMRELPDPSASFLLVEYPGYGRNNGDATPETIRENGSAALASLREHLRITGDSVGTMSAMGHSLGAAAALMFTERHRVKRLLLLAPFTRMLDMARRQVGRPLCYLLAHRFDNVMAMTRVVREEMASEIVIVHGKEDAVIPVSMGRRLADLFPERIDYREIPQGTHSSILHDTRETVFEVMCRPVGRRPQ